MTIFKRTAAFFLALILLISIPVTVHAENPDPSELIRDLINYFQHYQGKARHDYDRILAQMADQDPALSRTWAGILDFWVYLNEGMDVHNDVLPDGLPEDDSLCIAVMGYYLKPDGSMRDELYDRLEVTLRSAEKYPNAYILCTGGGADKTEAGQMSRWLIRQGIPEERIILEKKARSTIENAKYGCALLYRDYPQVKNLAVITSDYHIFRSCLYFNTQAALDAYDLGVEPMRVLASATCPIPPDAPSDLETQVEGMSILTGLSVENLPEPPLARLEELRIEGSTEYPAGAEPALTVTAIYSNGFSRDVTSEVTFSGIDFGKAGIQTVSVSYEESGTRLTASVDITFLPPPTEPTEAPMEAPTVPSPTEPAAQDGTDSRDLAAPLTVGGVCLGLLLVLILLKSRLNRKRRRRPKRIFK